MQQIVLGLCFAAFVLPSACDDASQLGKTRSFRGASTAKWGSCGEFTCAETYVSWRPCQCNSLCKDYENCCSDYQAVCVSPPTPAIQDPVPSPPPASPTPALPDTSEQPVPVAVAPAETTPPAPANAACLYTDFPEVTCKLACVHMHASVARWHTMFS